MRTPKPVLPILAALALMATIPACAPANTGTTVSRAGLGSAASVSFGTIVGSRPVQVQGTGGVGTLAGAAAGGVAGSFIGGDWRSNALAGIGGAIVGGLAGNAIERGVTTGTAIEFIVREDRGGDIAVVQTNEEGLQVGDRVVITRGDRVRLSRAAGGPPGVTSGAAVGAPMGATTVSGPGPAK
jgi:outer membrane lipoprotein SlyB